MLALEGWTLKNIKTDRDDYHLVQFNENVTIYRFLHTSRAGNLVDEVRFFGAHHAKRAAAYAAVTGGTLLPTEKRGTATTVRFHRSR